MGNADAAFENTECHLFSPKTASFLSNDNILLLGTTIHSNPLRWLISQADAFYQGPCPPAIRTRSISFGESFAIIEIKESKWPLLTVSIMKAMSIRTETMVHSISIPSQEAPMATLTSNWSTQVHLLVGFIYGTNHFNNG
jgi:hypothetical protein